MHGDFQGSFDNPSLKNKDVATPEELERLRASYKRKFPVSIDCYGEPGGAIWNYIATLAMASDYTSAFLGITQWKMLKGLIRHAAYIGPIVSYNRHANVKATIKFARFARLVKCAYVHAVGRLNKYNPEDIHVSLIRDSTEKKQHGVNPLGEKRWFPSFWALELRKKHLAAYIHMISQVGDDDILEPEDVTKFGYVLIDGTLPPTRDNIVRQTKVEEPEQEEEEMVETPKAGKRKSKSRSERESGSKRRV